MKIGNINEAATILEHIQDYVRVKRAVEQDIVVLAVKDRDVEGCHRAGLYDGPREMFLRGATKEQRAALEDQLRNVATEWLEEYRAWLLHRLRALGVEVDRDAAE